MKENKQTQNEIILKIIGAIYDSCYSSEYKIKYIKYMLNINERHSRANEDCAIADSLLENDNEQTETTEESNDFESIPIIAVNGSLFGVGKFIRCNQWIGVVKDIRIPVKGEINENTIKITAEIRAGDENIVIMEFPAKDCEDILKYALSTRD